jgi:hypothetical protein
VRRVEGGGYRVYGGGLGWRVHGVERRLERFAVQGLEGRVLDTRFRVEDAGFSVEGLGSSV